MEPGQLIDALERHGQLLADAAVRAGLDAAVPPCAPWRVNDLLRHLGYVHRWATIHVAEQRSQIIEGPTEDELLTTGPADDRLIGWFRDGHAALVTTLRTADPDVACATFLPAPSPLTFWARRQAHETAIHRADVETAAWSAQFGSAQPRPLQARLAETGSAQTGLTQSGSAQAELPKAKPGSAAAGTDGPRTTGSEVAGSGMTDDAAGSVTADNGHPMSDTGSPPDLAALFPPDFAADGIDELVMGFARRRRYQLRSPSRHVLHVRTTDTGDGWLVDTTANGTRTARGTDAADCVLSGPASGLYLTLWNRCAPAEVGATVSGDVGVLRMWRDGMHVRWS